MNINSPLRRHRWLLFTIFSVATVICYVAWLFFYDHGGQVRCKGILKPSVAKPQHLGEWRVELTMHPDELSRILDAQNARPGKEFEVELIVSSSPVPSFRGRLLSIQNQGEPGAGDNRRVVVRLFSINGDIPQNLQIPEEQRVDGVEVFARIRF